MTKLIIYKDKITIAKWHEQEKIFLENDISGQEGSITKYFNKPVEIKPDVTIKDFMNHLERYESVIDYCFSDYLKHIPLKVYLDDMNKADVDTDLGEIELCWEGEIINDELVIVGYLRAWLKEEKVKELGEEQEIPHDISFLSIHIWKNCNLLLNENIVINNLGEISNLKQETIFNGFYRWTLFDIISRFLEELCINGTPVERDNLLSQMESKKYNIQEIVKSQDQIDFWLSFLESELESLKSLMESSLENEDYEEASKLKLEIETAEKELLLLKEEIKKVNG